MAGDTGHALSAAAQYCGPSRVRGHHRAIQKLENRHAQRQRLIPARSRAKDTPATSCVAKATPARHAKPVLDRRSLEPVRRPLRASFGQGPVIARRPASRAAHNSRTSAAKPRPTRYGPHNQPAASLRYQAADNAAAFRARPPSGASRTEALPRTTLARLLLF